MKRLVEHPFPRPIERGLQALLLLSVTLYLVEVDVLRTPNSLVGSPFLLGAERLIALLLTCEYGARYLRAPNRPAYLASTRGILDLLAILPFWCGFLVPAPYLHVVRTLRVLRLLKFYRYNRTLQDFVYGLKQVRPRLVGLAYVVGTVFLFSSVAIREIEGPGQPEKFGTITNAMYWTVVSMTSTGYGDMVPLTPAGKLLTSLLLLFGLGLLGTLVAVIQSASAMEACEETVDVHPLKTP